MVRGWPSLGNDSETPIDAQSFRHMGPAENAYPLGAEDVSDRMSTEPKRYGPRSIHPDALPVDLRLRSIEEQRRNPDGSYTRHEADAPMIEQFLQRIVNSLEILTKPKYIKKSFFTRQLTLVANATAVVFIESQSLRGYLIQNTSGISAYIGAGGVTAASGFEIQPNKAYEFYLEEGVNLYAFSAGNAVLQYIAL